MAGRVQQVEANICARQQLQVQCVYTSTDVCAINTEVASDSSGRQHTHTQRGRGEKSNWS